MHTESTSVITHYGSFMLSLCCRKTALECPGLRDLGITHVLNAAEGKFNNVLTGADYYRDMDIQYFGVEADDKPTFNISQYFCSATQFIHDALSHPQSKLRGLQKAQGPLSKSIPFYIKTCRAFDVISYSTWLVNVIFYSTLSVTFRLNTQYSAVNNTDFSASWIPKSST